MPLSITWKESRVVAPTTATDDIYFRTSYYIHNINNKKTNLKRVICCNYQIFFLIVCLPDIRVEILLEVFGEFALSHNFRSQNEVVAMRKSGTFVYAPTYWNVASLT